MRFDHPPRWLRDHERFALAWGGLMQVLARRGLELRTCAGWLEGNFGVDRVIDLTAGDARCARRRVNAWRAAMEGRTGLNTATRRRFRGRHDRVFKERVAARRVLEQESGR